METLRSNEKLVSKKLEKADEERLFKVRRAMCMRNTSSVETKFSPIKRLQV